jgi:hypothetical protein
MKLSHPYPSISIPGRERVEKALEGGCTCGGETARLTQRRVHVSVAIHMQCDTCGRSLCGALKKADHAFSTEYPWWDEGLSDRYQASENDEAGAYREAAWQERRANYHQWLQTDEWKALRLKIMRRANGVCEGCLESPAQQVHHDGYENGKMPPAWKLRAVCLKCHEKLHAGWSDFR